MKKALSINALFSGLSGLSLLLFHWTLANFFGIQSATPFLVIGIALVFFALTILFEIRRQNPLAILWIITQDMLWVVGSLYILLFSPFDISKSGHFAIAVVAIIVLLMALNQSSALAQADTVQGKEIKKLHFTRTIAASKAKTWKVVSDVANYQKVAPNIDKVEVISGEGQGMVRSCSHGKDSWTETCSLWEEEKQYSFIVDTSAPDYPYPLKYLKGSWEVEEVDPTHTTIHLTFEFAYARKFQNVILHPIVKGKFKKTAEELLDNWQELLEKK